MSSNDISIRTKLTQLDSLHREGLLPTDVYVTATQLATQKYLKLGPSPSTIKHPARTTSATPVITHDHRTQTQSPTSQTLWMYGCPLVLLLLAIICGLVSIDWILGVDRPRLVDYVLNPISTCSTHRTGRLEL